MTEERRSPAKPTEDRKLLQNAPYADASFLETDAWRALRIMGEFVEGFDALARLGPAISVFGSARTPESDPMYGAARQLGARLAQEGFTVITGGGPGIMEAANRGAQEAGGDSIGLAIELPHEQGTNAYCDVAVNFRYFFVRKTMFVKYAQGFVIFPGGFGTFDELFESLTLVQTGKIEHFPIVLFGGSYWQPMIDWLRGPVLDGHKVDAPDVEILRLTDDVEEVVSIMVDSRRSEVAEGSAAALQAAAPPIDQETLARAEAHEAQREREAQTTSKPE